MRLFALEVTWRQKLKRVRACCRSAARRVGPFGWEAGRTTRAGRCGGEVVVGEVGETQLVGIDALAVGVAKPQPGEELGAVQVEAELCDFDRPGDQRASRRIRSCLGTLDVEFDLRDTERRGPGGEVRCDVGEVALRFFGP